MKKLVAIICLYLTVSVFAQSSHSEFKYDCSLCHSCESPTKLEPCLKACPRMEIITVHHTADEGPVNIVLDRFTDSEDNYEPVKFSHKAHAEMSGMAGGCEMCHHYNPPGKVVGCSNCHSTSRIRDELRVPDLKAAFHRQCIDCHQLWTTNVECADCHKSNADAVSDKSVKDYIEVSYHTKIEEPSKVVYETDEMDGYVTFYHSDHVNVFAQECISCHKQESCARCHMDEKLLKNIKLTEEEQHLACSNCHDTSDNCDSCHKEEIVSGFNHGSSTGFDPAKYHAKVECASCHKKPGTFKGLKSSCSSCHKNWSTDNFNHSLTGFTLDENHIENECADCHKNNDYNKPSCDNCHDEEIKYPDSSPFDSE